MPSNLKLNLKGIPAPIGLLKCKSVLAEMNSGQVLEISLRDPDIVEQLAKIIERSQDQAVRSNREGDDYIVYIKKG